ncbi:unnamed protein product [Calypogeia fissa]
MAGVSIQRIGITIGSKGFSQSRFQTCSSRSLLTLQMLLLLSTLLMSCVILPAFGSDLAPEQDPYMTSFYFPGFNASSNSLEYLRDAFIANDQVYLTSEEIPVSAENLIVPLSHGIGRVLYAQPIQGRHPRTGQPTSFSTTFIFSIFNPQQLQMGDGLAFLVTSNNSVVGSGGGYLGVLDQDANGLTSAHTFAVEFDTWQNPLLLDPDANHVGVDVNSMISQETASAGFWSDDSTFRPLPLTGLHLQAWIDCSTEGELQVSISPVLGNKPSRPLLSLQLDLAEVMGDQMYVGFAAATGDLSAEHVIHAWSFNTSGPARDFQFSPDGYSRRQLIIRSLCIGAASLTAVLIGLTCWFLYKTHQRNSSSSKVHIGDPEAVVLPADRIRDEQHALANLNISKILAETHMRAFTEGR